MPEVVRCSVNGRVCEVLAGTTVAAALLVAGEAARASTTGERRAPLCGMGICFECRAVVNGALHRRTCQMVCADGMVVETSR